MKILIFTSNAIRHKYVANKLSEHGNEVLVISECKKNDMILNNNISSENDPIKKHFQSRASTEKKFFSSNDFFESNTLPLLYKEINSVYIRNIVSDFEPDIVFVYGSSIIGKELLSIFPKERAFNLHLGISPYYRGSGTNFWPFVNEELEFVGSTILHIDEGIDTGDIVAHVRPDFERDDTVHSVGCKVIKNSVDVLIKLINKISNDERINKIPQWETDINRYYKKDDFDINALKNYKENLNKGLIDEYLDNKSSREKKAKIISL